MTAGTPHVGLPLDSLELEGFLVVDFAFLRLVYGVVELAHDVLHGHVAMLSPSLRAIYGR